jgi:GAF domain-containing protein
VHDRDLQDPFDAAARPSGAATADPVPAPLGDPARLHLLAETGLIAASAAARLPTLDRVARLAARAVRAPVAQVNLVTEDAQVPAAAFVDPTLPGPGGARLSAADAAPSGAWRTPVRLDASFCQYAARAGAPMVVDDATVDPLVRDSRGTTEAGIRAYASVPIVTPTGEVLGTVCAVDFRPRAWAPAEVAALEECAALAGEEVAARLGAAHALDESEARLQLALQAARLGAWSLDLRTQTLTASARCKEDFGRDPDAPFTYDDLLAAIHPDDRARVRGAAADAVAAGVDYAAEYRAIVPGGAVRWIAASGRVLYRADGVPLRMVGLTQDVTERHADDADRERLLAAERAARLRIERLQALTAALAAAATQAEVYEAILREGGEALGAAATGVVVPAPPAGPDDRTVMLDLVAARGWPDDAVREWARFPATGPDGSPLPSAANSPIADAIRHGEPVWLEGADVAVSRYPVLAPLVQGMALCAWLAVPFTAGEGSGRRSVGGLIVVLRDRSRVTAEDRDLLLAMGRQCAQALERARLTDAARAAAFERERLLAAAEAARTRSDAVLASIADAFYLLDRTGASRT